MASRVAGSNSSSAGRRRPAAGYARGEETRLRIIRAAVQLFGTDGFDRTSTRDIAARAAVNAPVLQYYFNGKEGLYIACVEYIRLHTSKALQPVIETVRARLGERASSAQLIDCVCYLYEQAADFLLTNSEIDSWKRFAAWEVLDRDSAPGVAQKALSAGIGREYRQLLCELVGRIISKPSDDEQTRIRVVTLGSQLSVFHHARQRALENLGWTEVNERGLKMLKAIVREQTQAALKAAARRAQ